MYPPIFSVCFASAAVKALLGTSPLRFYAFGSAPQPGEPFYALPYAVWQSVSGFPENYINQIPDIDSHTLQVDAYSTTAAESRSIAAALRDAIEPHAHVVAWRGEEFENETKLYRYSFDVDWLVPR
jgi:hypothetical protein